MKDESPKESWIKESWIYIRIILIDFVIMLVIILMISVLSLLLHIPYLSISKDKLAIIESIHFWFSVILLLIFPLFTIIDVVRLKIQRSRSGDREDD